MDAGSVWNKRLEAVAKSGFSLMREDGGEDPALSESRATFIGHEDGPLEGVILCLQKDDASDSYLHIACSSDMDAEKITRLSEMGAFFYETEEGRHIGCLSLNLSNYPLGADAPYDDLLMEINDEISPVANLNLPIDRFQLNSEELSLLPFFEQNPSSLPDSDISEVLQERLGREGMHALSLTDDQKNEIFPVPEMQDSPVMRNTPRPNGGARP